MRSGGKPQSTEIADFSGRPEDEDATAFFPCSAADIPNVFVSFLTLSHIYFTTLSLSLFFYLFPCIFLALFHTVHVYEVGQTLEEIASKYAISEYDIIRWNHIDSVKDLQPQQNMIVMSIDDGNWHALRQQEPGTNWTWVRQGAREKGRTERMREREGMETGFRFFLSLLLLFLFSCDELHAKQMAHWFVPDSRRA